MSCPTYGRACENGCYAAQEAEKEENHGGLSDEALLNYLERIANTPCSRPNEKFGAIARAKRRRGL